MRSLTRELAPAAVSLGMLVALGLGGVAYGAEPAQQVDVDLCAQVQAAVGDGASTVGDLPETLAVDLNAALGAGVDLGAGDPLSTVLDGLNCEQQTTEPTPTDTPEPEPTTPAPTTPATPDDEASFVDRDCGELAPGEAEQILADDPTDPNRLDRNRNGVPCELDEFGDEPAGVDEFGIPSSGGPTAGSGSNSQFEAMPSTAPETGRA